MTLRRAAACVRMISARQFPTPESPKSIVLERTARARHRGRVLAAQLSLLEAIAREAKSDSFEASRNIARLTHAVNGLRYAAGQVPGPHMPFPPFFGGFEPGDDIET